MIPCSGKIGTIDSLRNYSTDGLIAHVDFSNDYGFAGNTANDLTNTAAKYSTPGGFISVVSGSTATPGYIDLDGTTDSLVAGMTTDALLGLTSCTIDMWIRPDVQTLLGTYMANTDTNAANYGFSLLGVVASGNISVRMVINTGSVLQLINYTGVTFTNGGISPQWVNLFFTMQHSNSGVTANTKVFKPNGISASGLDAFFNVAGITLYGSGFKTNGLNIGRRTGGTQFFNGQVSSAKLYNRVLTQSEIEFNYNASKTRYGHT